MKKDSSNEVEKIICEEKDNDHKVSLPIHPRLPSYCLLVVIQIQTFTVSPIPSSQDSSPY